MIDLFSEEMRRNPYPMYEQVRSTSPVLHAPPPFDMWMIFDYDGAKRTLNDHEAFSSCVPAPKNWFIFLDPPQHTKLRALVNKGFTPRMVAEREGRIRDLARQIVDTVAPRGACDFVADVAGELPSYVIAELVGIPLDDGRLLYALTERMHTTTRTPESDRLRAWPWPCDPYPMIATVRPWISEGSASAA